MSTRLFNPLVKAATKPGWRCLGLLSRPKLRARTTPANHDDQPWRAIVSLVAGAFGGAAQWALAPLRVRGLDRVRLHADLTILAKLACALARARAVALAA